VLLFLVLQRQFYRPFQRVATNPHIGVLLLTGSHFGGAVLSRISLIWAEPLLRYWFSQMAA